MGETVLDFFAAICTAGVAEMFRGRHVVRVEEEERCFRLANARMKNLSKELIHHKA